VSAPVGPISSARGWSFSKTAFPPGDAVGGLLGVSLLSPGSVLEDRLLFPRDGGLESAPEDEKHSPARTAVPPDFSPSVTASASAVNLAGDVAPTSTLDASFAFLTGADGTDDLADLLVSAGVSAASASFFSNVGPSGGATPAAVTSGSVADASSPAPPLGASPPSADPASPDPAAAPDNGGVKAPAFSPEVAMNSYLGDYTGDPALAELLAISLGPTGTGDLPGVFNQFPAARNAGALGFSALGADAGPTAADPGLPGLLDVTIQDYTFGDAAFTPVGQGFPSPWPVELTGRIYAPTELADGPRPVIILMHGRHATTYNPATGAGVLEWPPAGGRPPIPSYQGYDYLGNNLASHGYVVVSLSANGINARDNAAPDAGALARAQLTQRTLDILRDLNSTGTVTGIPAGADPGRAGRINFRRCTGEIWLTAGGRGVLRGYEQLSLWAGVHSPGPFPYPFGRPPALAGSRPAQRGALCPADRCPACSSRSLGPSGRSLGNPRGTRGGFAPGWRRWRTAGSWRL
jgi:hypothetical protein